MKNDYCQPGYCMIPGHPASHDETGGSMRYMITIEAEIEAGSQEEAERLMFAGSSAVEDAGAAIRVAVVSEVDGLSYSAFYPMSLTSREGEIDA